MESAEQYWKSIWSQPKHHNADAGWIKDEAAQYAHMQEMQLPVITSQEIEIALKAKPNWRTPGKDMLHNYWLKTFKSLHQALADAFNEILEDPNKVPNFLTNGMTFLLPKTLQTEQPEQYRPITCLPTIYKLLTSIIGNRIYGHMEENNIITEEQKGCCRKSRGCKEQLIVDAVVTRQAITKHRNLHMSYIDYKKAFDSVPHSWLIEVLRIYRVNSGLISFLEFIMTKWRTTLTHNGTGEEYFKEIL